MIKSPIRVSSALWSHPSGRNKRVTSFAGPRRFVAAAVAAIAAAALIAPGVLNLSSAQAVVEPLTCGQVILPGSAWLRGSGVEVHHNLHVNGSTSSCGGVSTSNPAVQYGGAWQCVELAARLYYVKGWGRIWAGGNGGAKWIPEGSPWLQFFANGSGYIPVPGDLIIEAGGTYGHVTVVDYVTSTSIAAVEQNASAIGRHNYPLSGSTATGGYYPVRGFMHSAANTNHGTTAGGGAVAVLPSPAPAVIQPATTQLIGTKAGKKRATIKWKAPDATDAVNAYQVWLRQYNVKKKTWVQVRSLPVAANARSATVKRLTPGRTYRMNVRAGNAGGFGNWSTGKNVVPTIN